MQGVCAVPPGQTTTGGVARVPPGKREMLQKHLKHRVKRSVPVFRMANGARSAKTRDTYYDVLMMEIYR